MFSALELVKVVYKRFSKNDIDGFLALCADIVKDKPEAARRFVERLRAKARQLAETPGMGRSRGEDLRPNLFSFPVGQYILFYREQPGGIVLVRVIHGSRDLPALF